MKDELPETRRFGFVSVVVVLDQHREDVAERITDLSGVLERIAEEREIIIVRDAGARSHEAAMRQVLTEVPCIRLIELGDIYDFDTSAFSGIDVAIGEYVCLFNPWMDPYEDLAAILALVDDHDVVQGVSDKPIRSGPITGFARRVFYRYQCKSLNITVSSRSTHFLAFSRRAVVAMTSRGFGHRHLRQEAALVGFNRVEYRYSPTANLGSERNLRTGLIDALTLATNYSLKPLRVVTRLGLLGGTLSLIYALYVLIVQFINDDIVEGWTSTSLQISILFFLMFIVLSILAEYVGRIMSTVTGGRNYVIVDERVSTALISDRDKRNTVS